jgi:hypothetical protein
MKIASKQQMYDMSERGLLGNVLTTLTWAEFITMCDGNDAFSGEASDNYVVVPGRFGLRHRNITGFKFTKPVGDAYEFETYVRDLLREKTMHEEDVVVCVITDLKEDRRTLQGEIWLEAGHGLTLGWSGELFNPYTCREEMRRPGGVVEDSGMRAKALLDTFMDANSRAWVDELLDTYQDHVIEFSSFSNTLGCFGWNTLFWEVRNY